MCVVTCVVYVHNSSTLLTTSVAYSRHTGVIGIIGVVRMSSSEFSGVAKTTYAGQPLSGVVKCGVSATIKPQPHS